MREKSHADAQRPSIESSGEAAAQAPGLSSEGAPPSTISGPPRKGSARRDRLRRLFTSPWPVVAVLALLLSSCQIRQEIRFNADGSGTAIATVGIDKNCPPLGTEKGCSEPAQRLLGGKGPVAHAEASAKSLPFHVRIEPFETGPAFSGPAETGYSLSFDFASIEDLKRKLAPEPPTGQPQTSPFEFSGMTFEANREGGFTFTTKLTYTAEASAWAGSGGQQGGPKSFAVVLPGAEGENNADVVQRVQGGTRFQWYSPGQLQASTCSRSPCGGLPPISPPILIGATIAAAVAAVGAFVLVRRRGGKRLSSGAAGDVDIQGK